MEERWKNFGKETPWVGVRGCGYHELWEGERALLHEQDFWERPSYLP